MTEPRLSAATRSLLRAAKADAPNAAVRAKVWAGVAGTVGGAAGAGAASAAGTSAAPGALVSGGVGASKMLALGTLLGGTVTVGLAAVLLHVGPMPRVTPGAPSAPAAAFAPAPPSPPSHADPSPPLFLPFLPAAAPAPTLPATAPARATAAVAAPAVSPSTHVVVHAGAGVSPSPPRPIPASPPADDTLAREATFVVEARAALGRGDPRGALRAIQAARGLPSHQLGPEELAVEAQALRALGKDEQARDVDSTLRKQFPESALAR